MYFTDAEILALQEPDTVQEAQAMKVSHQACFQELKEDLELVGCGRKEFDWAVSVLHSRCFIEGPNSTHMTVPGVDMANHSFTPNASVRCVHSPGACQGVEALEEVCQPLPPQPATFQLMSGPDGIREGEEVTISYGDWPNDVFLLFFGFLPQANEHDSVVLFHSLHTMVHCYLSLQQQQQQQQGLQRQLKQHHMPSDSEELQTSGRALGQTVEMQTAESTRSQPAMHTQTDETRIVAVTSEPVSIQSSTRQQDTNNSSQQSTNESLQQGTNESLHQNCSQSSQQEPFGDLDSGESFGSHVTESTLELQKRLGPGDWTRLQVTAAGFDGRLVHAAQELIHLQQSHADADRVQRQLPSMGDMLSLRCGELLSQFATSEIEDMQELRGQKLSHNMQLAVQYRRGKKQMLRQARDASIHI